MSTKHAAGTELCQVLYVNYLILDLQLVLWSNYSNCVQFSAMQTLQQAEVIP